MTIPASSAERIRRVLSVPTDGVLGMVDELLAVASEHGLQLNWQADNCRVRFRDGDPREWIKMPLRKSVVRAALARVAVLCSQCNPNTVTPYGGRGELRVGADRMTTIRVAFVNTPDEQSLELTPLRNENLPAIPDGVCDGQLIPQRP